MVTTNFEIKILVRIATQLLNQIYVECDIQSNNQATSCAFLILIPSKKVPKVY